MPIPAGPLAPSGTTAADLIEITKTRYLLGYQQEQRNRLSADYTSGQTTLAFQYSLGPIKAGTTLSVGLNTFYVWDVNETAQTASVEGGYAGSTDADANSGTPVQVSPRWSNSDIFQALNEELNSLSSPLSGMYQMLQTELTYNPARVGFDLPGLTDVTSIYEVRYTEPDLLARTPVLDRNMWRLERNNLTSEFSSTYSLKISQSLYQGQKVTVLYQAPFTAFATYNTEVAATGLSATAWDILPLGAALRVGAGAEARRNSISSQPDTRRATEVPPGAAAGSWRQLAALRVQRIAEEASRLAAAYPRRL